MRHSILILAVVSALCAFAVSCSRESSTSWRPHEITGSRDERVATLTDALGERAKLPGEILDARFIEERIGDGFFGPSDFRAFCMLQVRSEDIAGWERLLRPLSEPASYAMPQAPPSWWVSEEEFRHLRFFGPGPLAWSTHGWAGVSPDSGRIYIFSFSM